MKCVEYTAPTADLTKRCSKLTEALCKGDYTGYCNYNTTSKACEDKACDQIQVALVEVCRGTNARANGCQPNADSSSCVTDDVLVFTPTGAGTTGPAIDVNVL